MKNKTNNKMLSEQVFLENVSNYINEDITSKDVDIIRKLIRTEIAEVFFALFRKRGVWV